LERADKSIKKKKHFDPKSQNTSMGDVYVMLKNTKREESSAGIRIVFGNFSLFYDIHLLFWRYSIYWSTQKVGSFGVLVVILFAYFLAVWR